MTPPPCIRIGVMKDNFVFDHFLHFSDYKNEGQPFLNKSHSCPAACCCSLSAPYSESIVIISRGTKHCAPQPAITFLRVNMSQFYIYITKFHKNPWNSVKSKKMWQNKLFLGHYVPQNVKISPIFELSAMFFVFFLLDKVSSLEKKPESDRRKQI